MLVCLGIRRLCARRSERRQSDRSLIAMVLDLGVGMVIGDSNVIRMLQSNANSLTLPWLLT